MSYHSRLFFTSACLTDCNTKSPGDNSVCKETGCDIHDEGFIPSPPSPDYL